jgi:hydroxyacylglutathione hydrolase
VSFEIGAIPIGADNYSYLIISNYEAAIIDATGAEPVLEALAYRKCILKYILSTHHHTDHTGGNRKVKKETGCLVAGGDARINEIDLIVNDNDELRVGNCTIRIISVPGHTRKQVAFFIEQEKVLFTGDTLFGAGCGRIFECGPEQLYNSLEKIAQFPEDTQIYFGHEYTLENCRFALTVEPDNQDLVNRMESVDQLLKRGAFSTPSTLLQEKKTNPFLRTHSKTIQQNLQMVGRSPIAIFTELRKRKDRF